MKIENLISTMNNQDCISLYKKMNISSDAVIINQQQVCSYKEKKISNNLLRIINTNSTGVGFSRNTGLMMSRGDIIVMSDDDMIYLDDYEEKIKSAYKKYPDADLIVFNVRIHQDGTIRETVKKNKRVKKYNSLRYGTVTFTFKKGSIQKNNIFFSLLFGGGAKYGSGEDSLFIWTALSRKLKVYSVEETIADVYNDESSWFTGYDDKFFEDKGALFKALSPKFSIVLILQFAIRRSNLYIGEKSIIDVLKLMISGASNFKKDDIL